LDRPTGLAPRLSVERAINGGRGHERSEGILAESYLEKNPGGGVHHVCYEVEDIIAARDRLKAQGARVLGDGEPRLGAHDKPILFLHPKDFCGTLVDLEQV